MADLSEAALTTDPQTGSLPTGAHTFTVSELDRISFVVEGSSPSLRYEASGLPRNATFDPGRREFTWRPRPGQDGTWAITFAATDQTGSTSTVVVRINVRALGPLPRKTIRI